MEAKKSKFGSGQSPKNLNEEEKASLKESPSKKGFDNLKINVPKLSTSSPLYRWQEYRMEAVRPDRRSSLCSCVVGSKLFVLGGSDIRDGDKDSFFSIDLEGEMLGWTQMKYTGDLIGKLSHSASVLVENTWYIIGGYINDSQSGKMYTIDMETLTCSLVPAKPDLPQIDSHTAVWVEQSQKILVYGGYIGSKKNSAIFEFSKDSNSWRELERTGIIPEARSGHSAIYNNGCMYIFGGIGADFERRNDLWKYSPEHNTWTQVEKTEEIIWPRERNGHSASIYKDKMLIFGGSLGFTHETNELYSFDFSTEKWEVVHPSAQMDNFPELSSPGTAMRQQMMRNEYYKLRNDASPGMKAQNPTYFRYGLQEMRGEASPLRRKGEGNSPLRFKNEEGSPLLKTLKSSPRLKGHRRYGSTLDRPIPSLGDELCSPLVNTMRDSVVMKAMYSNMRKTKQLAGEEQKTKGVVICSFPCGRDGHTAQIYKDRLWIFGGDRNKMAFNDLYSYPCA